MVAEAVSNLNRTINNEDFLIKENINGVDIELKAVPRSLMTSEDGITFEPSLVYQTGLSGLKITDYPINNTPLI